MSANKNTSLLLVIVLLAIALAGAYFGTGLGHAPHKADVQTSGTEEKGEIRKDPSGVYTITPQRRQHILYGDRTGGGHKSGAGKPGKTEFPSTWDDDKIINTAISIANDATSPERPSGKYWLKMKEVDGVQVRVVIDRDKNEVVTTYPLNQPKNPQ